MSEIIEIERTQDVGYRRYKLHVGSHYADGTVVTCTFKKGDRITGLICKGVIELNLKGYPPVDEIILTKES